MLVQDGTDVQGGTDVQATGEISVIGHLVCVGCGYSISLSAVDELPSCPGCGSSEFRRASLFEQPTVDAGAIEAEPEPPAWLEESRAELADGARCLAFEEDGEPIVLELDEGWARIGRSGSADIRLDDPTVSRRHALVVRTAQDRLRVLDDRSLNGLYVNGERVDWAPLEDGDELEIGCYRLYVLET